tara:strand:+ start:7304 stop:7948 length:645 start_codon:yes stop_codon:yes gene_type:complete
MANLSHIHISGQDAVKFLQGQLTCDINKISDQKPITAAHCNAKGRIVSLFDISHHNDGFQLLLPSELLLIAVANLKKYAIFSKVDIDTSEASIDDYDDWRLQRIRHNIPTVFTTTSEIFLPHYVNLLEHGGVSFTKGCYTGQEIIARMQHLGNIKRHMHYQKMESETCPQPGDNVYAKDKKVGDVVDAIKLGNTVEATVILSDSTQPSSISCSP